ncbi:hypothetical protein HL13_gp80 [Dinoroseobacter phage DFL12phi1]|uniref:Uncharacterized protein n=2 Tax=Baltimorevirus DFL12 TaxID=2169868 RepID=A0A023NHE3_9CAUD|nr:hypothetical protein HL13_gp80 [Dinoroseobacter phage DFL12phi1]AHX01040.1 hypothetical protein DFL12P1_0080 [Dinoroseobacter phage DFL12phi1]AID16821.1 hypothetical protein vBDshPR2C_05 [Dinoroseobacter phage vBDshPR2C]
MIRFPKKTAPRNFDSVTALKSIDEEMTDILYYLSTEKKMEPQDIIDNTERLHELAIKRSVLVEFIKHFSTTEWRPYNEV